MLHKTLLRVYMIIVLIFCFVFAVTGSVFAEAPANNVTADDRKKILIFNNGNESIGYWKKEGDEWCRYDYGIFCVMSQNIQQVIEAEDGKERDIRKVPSDISGSALMKNNVNIDRDAKYNRERRRAGR